MDADVAVTDPRVEPIMRGRDKFISVHPRSSAAEIPRLRRWLRVCGASLGFADVRGLVDAMYWSGAGIAPGSRFKGSVRERLNGVVAGFAVGSRFKGSVRDGLNGGVGRGVGGPCDGRMAGALGPAAAAREVGEAWRVGAEGENGWLRGSAMCLCGGAGLAGATGSGNANARG